MQKIKSFDMFASDIKVNVKGKSKIGSNVGVLLSAVYLGLFGYLAYLIISDFLDTSQPRISQGVNSTDLPPVISFTQDKLFPILNIGHHVQGPLKLSQVQKYVTLRFMKLSLQKDPKTGVVQPKPRMMGVVACADIFHTDKFKRFEGLSPVEKEFMLSNAICMDPGQEDLTIGQETETDPFYQRISLLVLPCSLPTGCATRQELAMITLATIIPKPILNLSDKKNPIKYAYLADEVMSLSTVLTGRQTLNLLKTEIIDDAGFLQGKQLANSYTAIDSTSYSASDRDPAQLTCTPVQMMDNSCIPYWIQNSVTSPRKMVIKRQYKGMVETFSELGGTADMLLTIFFFPYSLYLSRILKEQLVALIHGVNKPRKPKKSSSSTPEQRLSNEHKFQKSQENYQKLVAEVDSWLNLAKLTEELKKVMLILEDNNLRRKGAKIEDLPDADDIHAKNDLSSFPLNQSSANFDSQNQVVPLARNLRQVTKPHALLAASTQKFPSTGSKNALGANRGTLQNLYLPREPAAQDRKADAEQPIRSVEQGDKPSDGQGDPDVVAENRQAPKFDW